MIQRSNLRQSQIPLAANVLFYEITNPIWEDPYDVKIT